jgi:acetyl-CoA synthetase
MSSPTKAEPGSQPFSYDAPAIVQREANVKDFHAEYERSMQDPEAFWAAEAENFTWLKKWDKVREWDGVHHKWFVGGQTNITLNCLDRHAKSDNFNNVAYIWLGEDGSERVITYGQLYRMVCRFSNGLRSLGVGKGDRVVIYMPLTIEGIVSMLACARVGAIHSVVYAGLGHAALRDRIIDAQAKVVITCESGMRRGKPVPLKPIVDEAIDGLDAIEYVIVVPRGSEKYKPHSSREINYYDLLKFSSESPAQEMNAEDPLFILYTSGTTGRPTGVVHVHGGYMVGITYHLRTFFDVKPRDIFWCTSDIGWVEGHSYIVYGPLCAGITTIFREGAIDWPNPETTWEIVERYGVTKMFTAPTTIRMFMRYGEHLPAAHDLTSLRLIACCGEPLNPEAWRWAQTYLAGDGKWGYVVDNWWQTELGGPTLGTPVNMAYRSGKAGIPLAGVMVDVVDAEGNSVGVNERGRLVLKGPFPHMMRTVWGDNPRYERDWQQIAGAYVTGDYASKDEQGYIAVLGRADDVLNVAGRRIGSAEVESALVSHPAVAEAAAIGIPDALKGERIKVFVVLRAEYVASERLTASLVEHVRRELGPIATPAALEFVTQFPKTRSGKIMRRYLKAKETGQEIGDISTMEQE